MIEGIIWAISAGLMLGFYALPEKFTKDFEFENTWGTMFTTALFIVPMVAGFGLINGFGAVLAGIPTGILIKMAIASILWGIGVMMWGKAINYIGLSLGFSLFIGTVILVGSLLPFFVVGVPQSNVLATILVGIAVVLVGIFANGKAGLVRQAEEQSSDQTNKEGSSMVTGILIAVIGGLLATGFSYANAVGGGVINDLVVAQGNPAWMTAIAVMFIIYVAGGIFVVPYFIVQLTQKGLWVKFKTAPLGKNITMTSIMALLNFAASAAFAYAAFKLGKAGGTVGYAIFNTISVAVAIVSGLVTGEWIKASNKAKNFLYVGLIAMMAGVVVIAFGNALAS